MTPIDFSMIFCVGSIVLGVFAWLMGIWAIRKYKPWKMTFSYLFCALALLLQLFEVKNRALGGDFAAIEDTIRAVVFAGIVMLSITVILNLAAKVKSICDQRKAKKEVAK